MKHFGVAQLKMHFQLGIPNCFNLPTLRVGGGVFPRRRLGVFFARHPTRRAKIFSSSWFFLCVLCLPHETGAPLGCLWCARISLVNLVG